MFEVARGAVVYGYFFYPLYVLGAEQLTLIYRPCLTPPMLSIFYNSSRARSIPCLPEWALPTWKIASRVGGEICELSSGQSWRSNRHRSNRRTVWTRGKHTIAYLYRSRSSRP